MVSEDLPEVFAFFLFLFSSWCYVFFFTDTSFALWYLDFRAVACGF